jgi:hypothetical protein
LVLLGGVAEEVLDLREEGFDGEDVVVVMGLHLADWTDQTAVQAAVVYTYQVQDLALV